MIWLLLLHLLLLVTVLWQLLMQKIEVSGELTTGSTLQIADVFIRDEDGDPLSLDKMNNADDIKWYLVDNEAADPSGTPAATGTAFTIPADAGGKKIKIVYRIKTATGCRIVHSCLPLSY